jgi:hypothetical protein
MSGRLILLIIAALGLSGLLAWDIGQRNGGARTTPTERSTPELIAPAMERPLFNPTRRAPAEPPAEAKPQDSPQNWRLIGIAETNGVSVAVIEADGARARLKRGQSLNGWRLESVGRRSAVLVRDDQRKELRF